MNDSNNNDNCTPVGNVKSLKSSELKNGSDFTRSSAVSTQRRKRSDQISRRDRKAIETEKERVEDEQRYKMIFGAPDFEFKKRVS